METRLFKLLQHSPPTSLGVRISQFFHGVTEQQLLNVVFIILNEMDNCFKVIIELLKMPPTRPYYVQRILIKYFENFSFFERLMQINKKILNKSVQIIKYQFYPSGKTIYHSDENNKKFYVILQGNVQLLYQKTDIEIQEDIMHSQIKLEGNEFQKWQAQQQQQEAINNRYRKKTNLPIQQIISSNKLSLFSQDKQAENKTKAALCYKKQSVIKDSLLSQYASFISDYQNYFTNGSFKYKFGDVLSKGDPFGNKAFKNKKQSRAEAVLVLKDVHLLFIEKFEYDNLLKTYQDIKKEEFVKILQESFFSGIGMANLTPLALVNVSSYFTKEKLKKGSTLFTEGEAPAGCYIIKNGTIQIYITQMHYKTFVKGSGETNQYFSKKQPFQEKIEISLRQKGEIVGEEDVLLDMPRSYSAQVESLKASVYFLSLEVRIVCLFQI